MGKAGPGIRKNTLKSVTDGWYLLPRLILKGVVDYELFHIGAQPVDKMLAILKAWVVVGLEDAQKKEAKITVVRLEAEC